VGAELLRNLPSFLPIFLRNLAMTFAMAFMVSNVYAGEHFIIIGQDKTNIANRAERLLDFASKELDIKTTGLTTIHILTNPLDWMEEFKAVYIPKENIIFVLSDVSNEVLIHEISHWLVSVSSLNTLNVNCQEIIAGYVEYEYRKLP
jgi:hypothetical protein